MGGFYLKGPTHTIRSTAPVLCRCTGYSGSIDQQLQNFLINKVDRVLDLDELPESLKNTMKKHHLPDDMSYSISPNFKPEPYKPPVYNPNSW